MPGAWTLDPHWAWALAARPLHRVVGPGGFHWIGVGLIARGLLGIGVRLFVEYDQIIISHSLPWLGIPATRWLIEQLPLSALVELHESRSLWHQGQSP